MDKIAHVDEMKQIQHTLETIKDYCSASKSCQYCRFAIGDECGFENRTPSDWVINQFEPFTFFK